MRSSVKTRGVTGRKPGVTGQAYSRTEKELNGSLKRAEKQQLDEFLRARTEAVDKDIRELRSRLAVDGSRDLAEQPAYGELLHPRGPATLGRTDLMISGTGSPRKDRQVRRGTHF